MQQRRKNEKGTPKDMGMSLSQRIAEHVRKKKASIGGQNRAAFLALKAEIEEALTDGWPVKSVWETLFDEGKIGFSYQAFRKYVNTLIYSEKEPGTGAIATPKKAYRQPTTPRLPPQTKENDQTPVARAALSTNPKPERFNFDPNPRKEDYV